MVDTLKNLWSAISRLTGSLNRMADTVDTATDGLRHTLGIAEPPIDISTEGRIAQQPEVEPAANGTPKKAGRR